MKGRHRFHSGEIEAQQRFNEAWDGEKASRLVQLIGDAIDERQVLFIHGRSFFFLATADDEGNCDCSFKGTEPGRDGKPLPAVRVVAPRRLLFPDYAGNRMYNSLGNIMVNPHAGLLFIAFDSQSRLRINGTAHVLEEAGEWREWWPQALRAVEVTIDEVYWNCSKHIPQHP